MKKIIIIISILIIIAILIPITAHGATYEIVGADVIPAPVGYIYILSHPIGDVVGVFVGNIYKTYYAETDTTNMMYLPTIINSVLTKNGLYKFVITKYNETTPAVGLNLPGSNDLVLLSINGYVYSSSHRIIENYDLKPKNGDIVISNKLNLTINKDVAYIIPVTSPQEKITIITKKYITTEKISDLIGVQNSCIAFVPKPTINFPWYGGLIPSPLCISNINKIIESTYDGQVLYTVFSTSINGHEIYIVFSKITPSLLTKLGMLTPLQSNPITHIIKTNLNNVYIYYALSPYSLSLYPIKKINTIDTTIISNGHHICELPQGSKILFYLGWNLLPKNSSQMILAPGETILYHVNNRTYLCHGSFNFLNAPYPTLTLPKIKQFHEPIGISSSVPELVMLGNGLWYYGTKLTIPYSKYNGNTIWLMFAYPTILTISVNSLWGTPFFWLSILLGILFAGLILQKPRTKERTIKIVWDISTPPPLEFADEKIISKKVSQFVDIFGYCPNDVELAERGVLLPIKNEKPTEEVIVCNYNTNIETEKILRRVVKLANEGFWAFKRRGKNYGFLYTLVSDMAIIFYLYKQENEKEPSEILLNSIKYAMKTYIGMQLHSRYHGLIILTTPEMGEKMREELVKANVIDKNGQVADIEGYISVKFPDLDEKIKGNIIEFVNERIPIILIMDTNLRPMIDILGEVASQYYEEFIKLRGKYNEERRI